MKASPSPVRRWLLAAAVALPVIGLIAWALRPAALPVDTDTVAQGRFELAIEEDGVLRLVQRYTVTAPTAGDLQRPGLRVGDTVAEGEALAVLRPAAPAMIDTRTRSVLQERLGSARAGVSAADAQVARQQAALAQADLDVRRQEELARARFVSPAALEQAQLARRVAQQALAAAQAERRVAAYSLSEAGAALSRAESGNPGEGLWTLRSPVAGRVVVMHRESAGPIAAGQPIMDLGDTSRLEAVVDLLSGDAARVSPGAPATLRAGAGVPPLQGQVTRVEPVAFTKVSALGIEEQRVNVHIALQGDLPKGTALGEGYRVEARIVTRSVPEALLVPVAALVRSGEGWQVFVIDADQRARARAVTLDDRNSDVAVVTGGLAVGERVVRYPGNGVAEGQRIRERR